MATRRRAGAVAALTAACVLPLIAGVASGPAARNAALSEDPLLFAAGDIARCGSSGDEQTAGLLDAEAGAIAALGDLAYENGSRQDFADCYGPTWGRHKERTYPVPGNHEYFTAGAAPYFEYFGARAGSSGGYYSYDLGRWHVIALNSNCEHVAGGCGPGSPQEAWLRADLAASTADCTLAYWHHPSFSSGAQHGPSNRMTTLLDLLYAHDAELLLFASEHHYERFAPQTPGGDPSPIGMRAFVVGTGGALGAYPFRDPSAANSEVRAEGVRGLLRLTLRPDRYEWRFVPVAGETFTDSGSGLCHSGPPADTSAPTAPTALAATSPSSRRVDLSWSPSSDDTGVAGYRVFRNGVQVGSSASATWSDTSVAPATAYAYHVVAYDAAANVSSPSNMANVTTQAAERTLTFTPAADATIQAAVPAANDGASATLQTDGSPLKAFLLKFVVAGVGSDAVTSAKLRLNVVDSSNRGGDFRTASVAWDESTVTWQTAPAGATVVGSLGGVVRGAWHEVALASAAVTGDGTVSFRVDSPSSDGADYVSKEGAADLKPQLVLAVGATPSDTEAPTAPSGLTAAAPTDRRVELAWQASTDNVGVTGYRVFRNGVELATTSSTTYTDASVVPATTYSYDLVAFDAARNVSPRSNTASVTTPPVASSPTAPTALTATAISGTWVDLSWKPSSDDVGVSGYRVRRDGVEIATTAETSWADRSVSPGTQYSYDVVAYDGQQNTSPPATASVTTLPPGDDASLPLRAAFYYPWFPEAWTQSSIFPYTRYTPTLGWYDSAAASLIATHVAELEYGRFGAAIASWWGRGHRTDARLDDLLAVTRASGSSLKWAVYEEREGIGNPPVEDLREELTYLHDRYASHPNFLRVGGRFVVFVYNIDDGCEVVDRWRAANTVGAYLVLKVFSGHRDCAAQPDAWHHYQPGHDVSPQGTDSFSISPGFHNMKEPQPRLARDLDRWRQNIRELIASGSAWQLVTTFNEWGEGTAVESAREWETPSGHGAYLDALNQDGAEPLPDGRTLVFEPTDDAWVTAAAPDANNAAATTLEADGDPRRSILLKFAVTGVGAHTVTEARLRLHVADESDSGGEFSATTGGWSESTVTWSNAPAAGGSLGVLGRVFAGTWYDLVLPTGSVAGDGAVSVRIDSRSSDGVDYVSKEGTAARTPQLILILGPAGADTVAPTAPGALTATASPGQVALTWTAATDNVGVTEYRIRRNGATLATTTGTAYTDTTVASTTGYQYEVVAYDGAGNASPPATASVTSFDTQAPTVPANVTATAPSPERVELAWAPSNDDVAVTGYRVVRDGAVVATTAANSYSDTNLMGGTRYSYEVVAFDAAGNASPPSAAAAVTTPAAVQTLRFTPAGDATIVAGSPSTNFGATSLLEADASPRKAFLLEYAIGGVGDGTVTGAKLRFRVTNGSDRGGDVTRAGTAWTEQSVTWANAPAAGAHAASLGPVAAGTWQEVPLAPGVVVGDGQVGFRVDSPSADGAAFDSKEAGAARAPELVVTVSHTAADSEPPTAPAELTALPVSSGRVDLAWSSASDNRGVAGYRIFRDGRELSTTASSTYSDTAVAPLTRYSYYVVAYDAAGNFSPASNAAAATTPAAESTLTFAPTADAYVERDAPSRNRGTATELQIDNSPLKAALLKFSVSGVGGGTVTAAKLRLRTTNGSDRGGDFFLTADGWNEGAVTWANAPAAAKQVASLGAVSSRTWAEVPLAPGAVVADGAVSFRVDTSSSDGAAYSAKEAGASVAPQLIVTVSVAPTLLSLLAGS